MSLEKLPTVRFVDDDGVNTPTITTKIILAQEFINGTNGRTLLYGCSAVMQHAVLLDQLKTQAREAGVEHLRSLGGAFVKMHDNTWTVYGSSEALGPCDKEVAAQLLRKAFPGYTIRVE